MISDVSLRDFRNFQKKDINISKGITVVVGPNASGKTNILESINLLATGKSFRAKVEEEMINYDEEIARVVGKIGSDKLEVVITRGLIKRGDIVEKTPRKRLLVNGVGKRLVDFSSNLKTVLFRPGDLDLVTESPSLRRKFMDTVLSQVDYEYRRNLLSYEKGLRRRNKLLLRIREEGASRSHLFFWDKLLIKNGQHITQKRGELVGFINKTEKLNDGMYEIEYDSSVISENRLEQYKREEIAAATTLVGPHRDDMLFFNNKKDLSKYGSRGEQRIGVLWVKIAELMFVESVLGQRPTLLLDDIFSELDHDHRALVNKIAHAQQTIITTADPHYIDIKKNEFEKVQL